MGRGGHDVIPIRILPRPVAGGGGVGRPPPPQLPIPKILFHPLAILFHPLANLCKGCVTGTGRSPPPLGLGMWMTSRGQCPRGGACECPRVGAFFKLMTSRGQCPRGGGGGCARCSTHPSSDPPPSHGQPYWR